MILFKRLRCCRQTSHHCVSQHQCHTQTLGQKITQDDTEYTNYLPTIYLCFDNRFLDEPSLAGSTSFTSSTGYGTESLGISGTGF